MLGQCWVSVGSVLGLCWASVVSVLGQCWAGVGPVLGQCWVSVGPVLGRCWAGVGPKLDPIVLYLPIFCSFSVSFAFIPALKGGAATGCSIITCCGHSQQQSAT